MSSSGDDTAGIAPGLNIVILATFAAEPIAEALEFWMEQAQLPAMLGFAPYNQVVPQLRDPAGMAATNAGGAQVLLVRLEDWAGDAYDPAEVERGAAAFVQALGARAAATPAIYLVGICPASTGVAGDPALAATLEAQKQLIGAQLAPLSRVSVLDLSGAITRYQVADWYDPLTDELARMPYTFEFYAALGTAVAQELFAALQIPCEIEPQTAGEILGAVQARGRAGRQTEESFVAPRNALEQALADQLAQVLQLDRVGIHDNFFELGGDSVLALEIISRIHTLFQIETPLMTVFFETPTVAGIAEAIMEEAGDAEQAARRLQGIMRLSDEDIELIGRENPS